MCYIAIVYCQDVSCNEISHLPVQIGDLSLLRSVDLRRNMLVELPVGKSRNVLVIYNKGRSCVLHMPILCLAFNYVL